MKTIEVTCSYCGKITNKLASEINRQKRKGRVKFYCSLNCHGKVNAYYVVNAKKVPHSNGGMEQNPFRWYIRRCKSRKNKTFNLTVEYLELLWNEQNGVCPFTGWKLVLRNFTDNRKALPNDASLDRIDNSKGYIIDNVRFVSLIFNFARNNWSDSEVIQFCNAVGKYRNTILC